MSCNYLMVREAVILDVMDIAEADDVLFDFSTYAPPGETITAVEITAEVERRKPDESAGAMVSSAPVVGRIEGEMFTPDAAGRAILQRVDARGRIEGNVYCLRCVATFSGGRPLALAAHLPVRRL